LNNVKSFVLKNFGFTAKNIGIIFIFTSIVNLINFIYHIVMGRLLGPEQYGILASIISFLFITIAISGTIQTSSVKFTSMYYASGKINEIRSLFILITKRVLIITLTVFLIIIIFLKQLSSFLNLNSYFPLIFLGIMIVESSLVAIGRGTLQGIKRFKQLGINLTIEVILKFLLGLLLVYSGLKANGAIIGVILALFISYLIIFSPLRDILNTRIKKEKVSINLKGFYKSITLILISTALFSLFSYTDIILVKHFFPAYEAGYYAAAVQIGRIILFFSGAIGIVILPRFSEKFVRKEKLYGTFYKSLLMISVISSVFLIFYYFFPENIVNFIYGKEFMEAASLIFIYGIFTTLISLIHVQIYYFISIGRFWYLIYMFLILIGQFIFIWRLSNNLFNIIYILIFNSVFLLLLNFLIIWLLSRRQKRINIDEQ